MKIRTSLRFWVAACLVAAVATNAHAQSTLYWSTNNSTQGGTGTWSNGTGFWGTVATGPWGSNWNNASNDTARFGGNVGTVTLGSNVTVGGVWFDTTAYTIANGGNTLTFGAANNALTLNNIAAATIAGQLGGSGNVTLSTTNPGTAGTLTLNGTSTSGWNGTTTINPGTTLALTESNQGLNSTSAITLNGGAITLTNTTANATTNNRINDSAGITSNGGTLTLTNTAGAALVYAETIGTVGLVRGQTNFVLTNNQTNTGNQTLTIGTGGLTRSGASNTSAVTFSAGGTGPSTTRNMIVVTGATATGAGGIIGPWATVGTAANAQTDYAIYNGSLQVVAASIAANNSEATWANNSNITLGATPTTVTGTRSLNSLRYTAGAGTLDLGAASFSLQTYGLLNGGSGLLTVSTAGTGGLTTASGGGNLYVTAGNNAITVSAPINDNGGAVTLVQSGSSTLTLSSTTSNFSGGIVLNAGTLAYTVDTNLGGQASGITVNGAATLSNSSGSSYVMPGSRSITVNDGAVLTILNGGGAGNDKTFQGVLSGSGALINSAGAGATFSNTGNTFTGAITINNGITFASLGDSSNPINISNSSLAWTGGAKTFALRPFNLSATGTSSTIINNGSGALTIQQNLGITGAVGARTLTLGGTFIGGANIFAGDITDGTSGGASQVSLIRSGSGTTWALSGTNTYSGATTNTWSGVGPVLTFRGMQALSPNTSLNFTSTFNGGANAAGSFRFLDDSATPASRSAVNVNLNAGENALSSSNQNVIGLFVGNNSVANGGTSASTQTGSTIQLGNVNFNQSNISNVRGAYVFLTGANGYRLQVADVNVTPQATYTGDFDAMLRADAPMTVTGTVRQSIDAGVGSTTTLQLEGAATGSLISGNILNSAGGRLLNVEKAGTGTWTFNGTNTYTGTTGISAGTLRITGNSTAATGAVAVSGGALGGTGSLGGAVTLSSTGGIDLRDGSATGTLTLGSTLAITGTLSGGAGQNNLYFDLGAAAAGADKVAASGAFSMTNNGAGVVNINQLGVAGSRADANDYDLITAAGGGITAGGGQFQLATTKAFGQTFSLGNTTTTALKLTTTQVTGAVLGNTTLSGTNPSWQTPGNFSGAAIPDYQSNVIINSAIGTSGNLTASQNINSLTYGTGATTATTVNSGVAAAGTPFNMLVIEAAGANGNTAGNGITLNNTSGTHTISANIGLAASQTWTIAPGAQLSVSGVISDFGGSYGLTKAGGGTLAFTSASAVPTYSGVTTITGGVLDTSAFNSGTNASPMATSGGISFTTANSTFRAGAGTTTLNYPSMSISGVTATFDHGSNGNNTPYFIPSLTGSGTFAVTNSGGAGTNVTFGTTAGFIGNFDFNNTTGNGINTPGLTDTALSKIRMSSGSASQTPTFSYTGIGNTTLNNRQFELYGTTASTPFAIKNNGQGTFVINTDLSVTATGAKTLNLGGTNTAFGNTFGGLIANGNGTISLTKIEAGAWTLTNNNTYTGATTISTGTLQLGDGGTAGSLAGTASIANNAALVINRSNAFTQATDLNGRIISGTGSFTQAGTGNTTLSLANTFSGSTTITAGTLTLTNNQSIQNSALTFTAPSQLVLSGTTTPTIGGINSGVNLASVSGFSNVTTLTLNPQSGTATYSGALTDGSSALNLVKSGAGTQVLSGVVSYTGNTTVNAGTLQINQGTFSGGTITLDADNATIYFLNGGGSKGISGLGGSVISSNVVLGNSVTATGARLWASTNAGAWNFTGNITGASGAAGAQAVLFDTRAGTINGGDRTTTTVSGVIANGNTALNLNFAITPQSSSSGTNNHPTYVNLTAANTFTGSITATRGNTGATSWLVIGGERWSDGGNNTPTYGRMGSGYLGASNSGNYTAAINFGSTATNIVNLDYFSSANQTWSGVIGGGANNNGALVKEGTGTLTLTAANGYNSLTTIGGGTLNLGFGAVANNILPSTTPLWMGLGTAYDPIPANADMTISGGGGGGTLQLTGAGNQTVASLTTAASTASRVLLSGPGNQLLTVTSSTLTIGANSGLNFDLTAGGANGSTVGTGIVVLTGQTANATLSRGWTVSDAGGFGLATVNVSAQVIRDTSTAALPASGSSSTTNYLTTSSSVNSVTSSQSTGSITTDTSGGNVTLTLSGGVTLSNNVWNFGGNGTSTAQVTGGTGLNSVASGNTISINNFNAGSVTSNSPILANGINPLIVGGTGTVVLNGVNTFTGNATVGTTINSGTLQIGGAGQLTSGTYAGIISINGGSVLRYSSSANQTLSGAISGPGGITKDTSNSDLTLSSANNVYTGNTTVSAGRLVIAAAGNLNNGGTTVVQSGAGQAYFNAAVTINNPFNISTTGYTEIGDSQNNTVGAIRMSGGTLSNTITLAGNSRVGAFGSTTNTISGQITGNFGIDLYGVEQGTAATAFILSNTGNNYTGNTTIYNALHNATATSSVTSTALKLGASNVIPDGASAGYVVFAVASNGSNLPNATVIFDLNGNNETINGVTVDAGTFNTRITNSASPASTLTIGANNTTSSFGGTITNSSGSLALTKIGNGSLILTGNNTYTGATNVNAGTLRVNGQLASGSVVTVLAGATLGGNGTVGGPLTVNGSIAPGNSIDLLTVANDVTWNGVASSEWIFELGASNTADLLDITGGSSDFLKGTGIGGTDFVFNFAGSTDQGTFDLVSWDGTTTFAASDFSYVPASLGGGNTGTFNISGGSTLQFVVVPEPTTLALLGTSAALLGLRLARRRKA